MSWHCGCHLYITHHYYRYIILVSLTHYCNHNLRTGYSVQQY